MSDCIFCKIIAGQIPAKKVYEDELMVAIEDIAPKAPLHLLLLPKRHFSNCLDMEQQDEATAGHLLRVAGQLARERGLDQGGFRLVQNNGADAGQTVFHLHIHLLAGREFAWPPG
ncbi:histidine triad nucleotide-binding protein [Trichlorobacter sp.]|uniref:histidine triad nucleotide-binding protein n=1 Tax=Trichlorobacter sp. TaxID=2911007 RepID=UPI002A36694D|nr:histidine triad nucleotide-binding protein [Trichlorobacter sp.]MDY0384139.1 histidine triad nucleotide-binding protein [Trichlorobacter sp.]